MFVGHGRALRLPNTDAGHSLVDPTCLASIAYLSSVHSLRFWERPAASFGILLLSWNLLRAVGAWEQKSWVLRVADAWGQEPQQTTSDSKQSRPLDAGGGVQICHRLFRAASSVMRRAETQPTL